MITGRKTLGILGGMGPLASLEFVRTLYEFNMKGGAEQHYPNILLHSLSAVPDRTQALLNSAEGTLTDCLCSNLDRLNSPEVTKIVICCFTSHSVIDSLPKDISEKLVSLVDLTARELTEKKKPALLLASLGSYQRQVFSSTEEAKKAKGYIVEPSEEDKLLIHGLIYDRLKPGRDVAPVYDAVKGLLAKYGLDSFIAGCTEFHMLSRYMHANGVSDVSYVDPLFAIAERLEYILEGNS